MPQKPLDPKSPNNTNRILPMDTLIKKNLYSHDVYQLCLARIEKLTLQTRPHWGSMSAAQMLAHCAEILEVANGKALKHTPFLAKLFKRMIRNMVVNEKPYPKNTRTHPQYKQTVERDFETEKERLLGALAQFIEQEDILRKHPLFGAMTVEEKGWSMYKHLDHHLSQFGV
jgi:hypothetical protein